MNTLEGISIWSIVILGFLPGLLLGSITAWLVFSRNGKTQQLQFELNELKERFTDYRDTVTQHFMHTSNLVQEMTESYRAVYEHLASGAQHLCNVDTGSNHLEHSSSKKTETPQAAGTIASGAAFDHDDLAELSSIRDDIDHLMGEAPTRPDVDKQAENAENPALKH